jgi:hypothetical protein
MYRYFAFSALDSSGRMIGSSVVPGALGLGIASFVPGPTARGILSLAPGRTGSAALGEIVGLFNFVGSQEGGWHRSLSAPAAA